MDVVCANLLSKRYHEVTLVQSHGLTQKVLRGDSFEACDWLTHQSQARLLLSANLQRAHSVASDTVRRAIAAYFACLRDESAAAPSESQDIEKPLMQHLINLHSKHIQQRTQASATT